ncbi:MAG: aldose 1-epimerase family protein [Clostridia bacterium]|nr:aldose 1-epimerase family protein [Clostridia bacterium]
MEYQIQNESLTLKVASRGAEMRSLRSDHGVEYLWQADPAIWPETSPILFPFVGRLTQGHYRYLGKDYPLPQHGFASSSEFSLVSHEGSFLTLALHANEETKRMYPFDFSFFVTFRLEGATLTTTYRVENHGAERMPFGLGAHPGFRVPLSEGEAFEDYRIEFPVPAKADQVGFTEAVFLSGTDLPYPLKEDRFLPLSHSLFDEDAVILKNMPRSLRLISEKSGRGVALTYPKMPYLGIWHWPKTQAEYLCLEPWHSLPSRQDIREEITAKSDLVYAEAGGFFETHYTITVF